MARYFRGAAKAIRENGFRSRLESTINQQLIDAGVDFSYEDAKIRYFKPLTQHVYNPDFILANGIFIEAKGMFDVADRKKHIYIREQHPEFDIRFLFSKPRNRLRKGSPTTYAAWCEKNDFLWTCRTVPQEWLDEKKTPAELKRIKTLLKGMQNK